MTTTACESCGYAMSGPEDHAPGDPHSRHCRYCSKPDGTLQDFDERFERMVQWSLRRDRVDRAEAERRTRAYMRTMPLWKDHPALAES
ncbi:MAG TPA: zinc ribbon domain-containing protein [Candidatus Baltobacteraceae bacterium]|nr:zinc ribbon domain-containing protein [Candidatus Baltobacteraceae bacterium]